MKKYSQSVYDYLVVILPDIQQRVMLRSPIDSKAAHSLFSIWKDEDNRIDEQTYKRPITLSASDLELIEKAGLAKDLGDRVEITEKGANVIKVMVLGDDRSVFDGDEIINYEHALANLKSDNVRIAGRKVITAAQKSADNWWNRFLK